MQHLNVRLKEKALSYMDKDNLLQQWLDKGNDDLRSAEYLSTI